MYPEVPQVAQPVPVPMPNVVYMPPPDGRNSPAPDITSSTNLSELLDEQFFIVPPGFHPNATFYGMEKELRQMHDRLFRAKKRAERLTAVLIHGVPGSGKTHLARQYIWAQRDCYPGGIFWVDAKSRQTTYKCYWEIAQAASLAPDGQQFEASNSNIPQKFVEEVRNWLQTREEWLMVFDGVTFDQDEDLNHFKQILPFRKRSSIIYTSVDRTLARKQRLYEPYCLTISPLRGEDACKLLFKDIGIKTPSRRQLHKATAMVKHYECLPLAIHAISHRLSATGKPIESYQINSHLTDEKLAEPFLSIMHDLYRMEHFAALNLINLLAFLGHQVPVGLINLGRAALEAWNVQILTTTRPGDHQEIDTTLGTLIRYGLLERTNSLSQQQSFSSSDGDDTADSGTPAPETSESQTDGREESFTESNPGFGAVDVIRIHSVIQGFCRDELKIMDQEQKTQPFSPVIANPGPGAAGFYDSWLVVATGVFCASYEKARNKMNCIGYGGMVKDYREYESHGTRLLEHFPKRTKKISKAPETVRNAHADLSQAIASIRSELRRLSRGSSQDLPPKLKSVFDRTSSSSSSAPDSSSEDNSREATLNLGELKPPQVESPQEMPSRVQLDLFPPHIFRESTSGHETDDERDPDATVKESHLLSQMVRDARRPSETPSSDWQEVESSMPKSNRGLRFRSKSGLPPHLRSPKPAAPILRVFEVHRQNAPSGNMRKARRGSQVSAASEALAAVQGTPPSSRGSNADSAIGSPTEKENMPTYATVAASKLTDAESKKRSFSGSGGRPVDSGVFGRSSAESLHSRGSHISQAKPFSPDRMSHSASSEAGPDALAQHFDTVDLRAAHDTHFSSLQASTTLKPQQPAGDMSGSYSSIFAYGNQSMHVGDNADIRESRRMSAASRSGLVGQPAIHFMSVQHPSAFMPGSSPPSINDLPGGYASDPLVAEPMSRGPSGNSRQSWSTDPVIYPPGISHVPANMGVAAAPPMPAGVAHMVPQHQSVSGTGGWVGEAPTQPIPAANAHPGTLHPEAAYAAHPAPEPFPGLYFGHQPVDLSGARHRLYGHSPFQISSPPNIATYQLYHPNLSTPMIPHPQEMAATRGAPARRGRSGSMPGYEAFGR